jgi:hypothetical protein
MVFHIKWNFYSYRVCRCRNIYVINSYIHSIDKSIKSHIREGGPTHRWQINWHSIDKSIGWHSIDIQLTHRWHSIDKSIGWREDRPTVEPDRSRARDDRQSGHGPVYCHSPVRNELDRPINFKPLMSTNRWISDCPLINLTLDLSIIAYFILN